MIFFLWSTESFINVLSFEVASDGDLNISAFPTLGAKKHSRLNSSMPHLPIMVSVELPSSMHLWKLPHKMLFLSSMLSPAGAHFWAFLYWEPLLPKLGLCHCYCSQAADPSKRLGPAASLVPACHNAAITALVWFSSQTPQPMEHHLQSERKNASLLYVNGEDKGI